jgi:hypothetical protein
MNKKAYLADHRNTKKERVTFMWSEGLEGGRKGEKTMNNIIIISRAGPMPQHARKLYQ